MRAMMAEGDEGDDDEDPEAMYSGRHANGRLEKEGYMDASTQELSKALGANWDSQKLEETANNNNRALLEGIG